MFFLLFVAILFAIILLIVCVFGVEPQKHTINKKCQAMIQRIQPDNAAPKLTDMINYHRENAEKAVKYEV